MGPGLMSFQERRSKSHVAWTCYCVLSRILVFLWALEQNLVFETTAERI